MDGARKLKIALDETRMLILGAQVLLGFQLRGPFEKMFETMDASLKAAHAVSLMLMIVVVGLLIAPGVHHRVIDEGHATWRMQLAISRVMEVTLAIFATSLATSMLVAFAMMGGWNIGWAAALLTVLAAVLLWFGVELFNRKGKPMSERADERVPLPQRIDQMLTEARVILPGAQALLGFQLAVVMTEAFASLSSSAKAVHGFALACIALSTILLMAPAAYHRIVYEGEAAPGFLQIGSRFLLASTAALALGLSADAHVVIGKIADSNVAGLWAASICFVLLVLMWHVSPLVLRSSKNNTHTQPAE
jgi:Family of unknown function (DUF6328)